MKIALTSKTLTVLLLSFLALVGSEATVFAQGTAFTYQGRLNDGASPANGTYDLTFSLFNVSSGAGQVGNTFTNSATAVSNGLFTVTLDFGANFPGAGRWLEIGVRTNGGGAFATLSPRQPLTATPYALTASNLTGALPVGQLTGTFPLAQLPAILLTNNQSGVNLTGSFTGNGSGLTGLWHPNGNADTTAGVNFLGTTDNQPLEFKVNGGRALRLEPTTLASGAPNVIGGSPVNFVAAGVVGATISGGGAANFVGFGYTNKVTGNFGTVVGGVGNNASGDSSTAMGNSTTASGNSSTAMGRQTTASGNFSTAMGRQAKANHGGSFVWADSQAADFASTADNQFSIRAANGVRFNEGTSLFMGVNLGQKINLFSSTFGIGIQSGVQYYRIGAGGAYAWFSGGSHNDNSYNPGAGGTELMRLNSAELRVNGTFVSSSDRNLKENFAPVNPRAVLEKVAALPLSQWNYKADAGTRHLGPMAQDFYAAFGIGPDDKHIATVDADGVALAAIQGLNQKVEEKDAEIRNLRTRLEKLEQILTGQLNTPERKQP